MFPRPILQCTRTESRYFHPHNVHRVGMVNSNTRPHLSYKHILTSPQHRYKKSSIRCLLRGDYDSYHHADTAEKRTRPNLRHIFRQRSQSLHSYTLLQLGPPYRVHRARTDFHHNEHFAHYLRPFHAYYHYYRYYPGSPTFVILQPSKSRATL